MVVDGSRLSTRQADFLIDRRRWARSEAPVARETIFDRYVLAALVMAVVAEQVADRAAVEMVAAVEVEAGRHARPQLVVGAFRYGSDDAGCRAADDPRDEIALGDLVTGLEAHVPDLAVGGRDDGGIVGGADRTCDQGERHAGRD